MPEQLKHSSICQQITPANLAEVAEQSALIDVRSSLEFETEHIARSINIPLDELDDRLDEIPKQGQLVVICRSGKRAERCAHKLLSRGFQPTVLEGGLAAWRQAGLPVTEGKPMIAIERQIQLIVGIGVLSGVILGAFINPWFLLLPAFFGAGLTFAGLSGTCALGLLLMKAPWNQLPGTSSAIKPSTGKSNGNQGCCK